ncbi:unnamed protein product [Prunus armeniaca]|uniref:Uncharacterized protein n=1 Tax=Prunus armeniaca TaxID=36596 RepID=A0A6J5VPL3_PRUAR|nr:unnamed protein product [Prunus armeniaca]CAB4319592.1 unnamed protein product [Prunus armeniaca]
MAILLAILMGNPSDHHVVRPPLAAPLAAALLLLLHAEPQSLLGLPAAPGTHQAATPAPLHIVLHPLPIMCTAFPAFRACK